MASNDRLLGLSGAWLALFGRVALVCQGDCAAPDLRPWLVVAVVMTVLGGIVTVRASRRPG